MPIAAAQGRYFAERYLQVVQGAVGPAVYGGKPIDNDVIKKGVREVEGLLKSRYLQTKAEPFWYGQEPGIADLSIAPFLGRLYILSKKESGLDIFAQSDLHEELFNKSGEFSTFAKYTEAILSRPSWKETFDDE
jgi:glutathione S-transferase